MENTDKLDLIKILSFVSKLKVKDKLNWEKVFIKHTKQGV